MRYSTSQLDPLELERRYHDNLFDRMNEYQEEHPDATDEEIYDVVCFNIIPDRISAAIDYEKDRRRGI